MVPNFQFFGLKYLSLLLDKSESVLHLSLVSYWLNVFLFLVSNGGWSCLEVKGAQLFLH
jgi:hypothetical protein